jgi:hypothetical protein
MDKIGVAIGLGDTVDTHVLQLMTQDTKTGDVIWKPKDINALRRKYGHSLRLYSHAMFKVVLGKYYPTFSVFAEHYVYLCQMKFYGYIVHIPPNIDMDYCIEFVKKLFKFTVRSANLQHKVRVFFEHIPSEVYGKASKMAEFGRKLKSANLPLPVGLCIDTCHMYASGISPTNSSDVARYIREIETAGLPYIIHLNDSIGDEGSFIDRHAELGTKIWLNDRSGLQYIKQLDCDKIIELADPLPSLTLMSQLN